MFQFGERSWRELQFVHPELVGVAVLALSRSPVDFGVIDGRRTIAEQKVHIKNGASHLKDPKNSRHVPDPKVWPDPADGAGLSCAIDLMAYLNGKGSWAHGLYMQIGPVMKEAAKDLGVPLEWGYDLWGWDSGHFQLPEELYP